MKTLRQYYNLESVSNRNTSEFPIVKGTNAKNVSLQKMFYSMLIRLFILVVYVSCKQII